MKKFIIAIIVVCSLIGCTSQQRNYMRCVDEHSMEECDRVCLVRLDGHVVRMCNKGTQAR